VSPVCGKVEVLNEFRSWADVARKARRLRRQRIETTARFLQHAARFKSRSRGLDTVSRGVYPEPVEGLQTYPSTGSGRRSADARSLNDIRSRVVVQEVVPRRISSKSLTFQGWEPSHATFIKIATCAVKASEVSITSISKAKSA
jgi:hypothetical protein